MLRYSSNWIFSLLPFFSNLSSFTHSRFLNLINFTFFFYFRRIWVTVDFKKYKLKVSFMKKTFAFPFNNDFSFKICKRTDLFSNYFFFLQSFKYSNFFSNSILKKSLLDSKFNFFLFLNNCIFLNNHNYLIFFFFFITNKKSFFFKKVNNFLLTKVSTNLLFNFNVKFI